MTQSESLVLKPMPKPRDDIPKEYFVNGLPYSKGFGSTGKQSEILAQEEEVEGSCNPEAAASIICETTTRSSGFGSSGKQSEILAPEEEVEGSYNPGVDYSNGRVSLDAQQNPIQVTEHSAGNLSPNTEHDEEVADGSLSVIDEQDQNEVSKNHDRLKPEIFYGPYRKSAAKPFISVIVIALCMICVLPGTTASKAHLGYNQDAKKLQAHGKPQPSQQNAYETGKKIEDYRKQTEESRKRREVEDALLNKKGELQQEVRTERQMVASTAPPRDISRDKYEVIQHIISREGTLSIKIRHYPDEKVCSITIDTKEYSSKEKQDGNITVERSDTWCIFQFKNFTLKSYVNATVFADADLRRILHPDLFLSRLNDRIAVYHSNDQEGIVTISTVGENVQCSIQPTSVVEKISEERGNIVTTLFIKFKKAGVCFYNISCNMSGFIPSIIHEVENCSAELTVTTLMPSHSGVTDHGTSTTTDNTTTPSNETTTTPSNGDGTSGRPNGATIICLVVFGVFVIALTVYIINKQTINQWLRKNMPRRSTTTTVTDTLEDRSGDPTKEPLRKHDSNDSGTKSTLL